jgi:hypothetical protein
MNRSFLIVFIPAILVGIAYVLLSVYTGMKLNYGRLAGTIIGFGIAVYLVHRYDQRKRQRRSQ